MHEEFRFRTKQQQDSQQTHKIMPEFSVLLITTTSAQSQAKAKAKPKPKPSQTKPKTSLNQSLA
jgi:hypothetical protein